MGHSGGAGIVSATTAPVHGDGSGLKLVSGPDTDYQQAQSHDEEEPVIQFPKRESAAPVEVYTNIISLARV